MTALWSTPLIQQRVRMPLAAPRLLARYPGGARFLSFDAAGDLSSRTVRPMVAAWWSSHTDPVTASYASSGTALGNGTDAVNASGVAFNPNGDLFVAEQTNGATETVWNLVPEARL